MDVRQQFQRAFAKREGLFDDSETDCFRLFNGEGDGIEGLTIDRYGSFLLVQYFNEGLASSPVGEGLLNRELQQGISFAAAGLPFPVRGILVKNRAKIKNSGGRDFRDIRRSRLAEGELPPHDLTATQCGALAGIDLMEGQSTGIFLDMRDVRRRLEPFYYEKKPERMVNLFSYTGLFSVHALLHGVKSAVNIDLSRGVLRRARENYSLNGLTYDERDFVYGDALSWVKRFVRRERYFDFAVIDPPTFARNRKQTFAVKTDFGPSLASLEKTVPGGYILTSINTISMGVDEFLSFHPSRWERLFLAHESDDFVSHGVPYLKVALWRCR